MHKDIVHQAALIIEGRSTAVNSKFIQSLVGKHVCEIAGIIAESDLLIGEEIRNHNYQATQYLIFAGDNYYPNGGWHDFKDKSDDLLEANRIAVSYINDGKDWAHVVDLNTMAVLLKYGKNTWDS